MSLTVCLAPANTLSYPKGGGHLWVYLQWALALQALGCRVIWLEGIDIDDSDQSTAARRRRRGGKPRECVAILKHHLEAFGLADAVALYPLNGAPLPEDLARQCLDVHAAASADLLLNLWHSQPAAVVRLFRRSAYVDTDPGVVQVWMSTGEIQLTPHDVYFTIGETVGTPEARFPDCGLHWHYTPPRSSSPNGPRRERLRGRPTRQSRTGGEARSPFTGSRSPTRSAWHSSNTSNSRRSRTPNSSWPCVSAST